MTTLMLFMFLTPYNCYTLPPADARELVQTLGMDVLEMAEMQNRRAGVPHWWLQEKEEELWTGGRSAISSSSWPTCRTWAPSPRSRHSRSMGASDSARRICNLRQSGHAITSTTVVAPNGKHFKEYRLGLSQTERNDIAQSVASWAGEFNKEAA